MIAKLRFKTCLLFSLCFYLFFSFYTVKGAESKDSKARGLEIAIQMREANEGFVGETAQMKMILIDAYENETTREMVGQTLEVPGDGDKSLMIFNSPRDVAGTKMLTWSKREGDDDQWLYLPSLRRTRRISSNNRMSSFMGSEFSFEDLGSQEVERYEFDYIESKVYNDEPVYVLERVPKDRSGYSKMLTYVSKEKLSPLRIDYFDRREELLKTATFSNFRQYTVGDDGKKMWRSNRIHMKNVQTQKESIFEWEQRELGVSHPERAFTQAALSD